MPKKEPLRYIENARELLAKSPIEEHIYIDEKYVRSACGVAYVGVLKAIDEYLLRKGLTRKELPKKVEEYEKALKKYAAIYDGKLLLQFRTLYDELHIAGYYRGTLHRVATVKSSLEGARVFIEKILRQ
jgi:Domain of unknown function (DUF5618)